MTYRGKIKNGVVVLEGPSGLPEGTEVDVSPVVEAPEKVEETAEGKARLERLKPFIGMIKDAPSDLSVNHDHYLYGARKQE
jgi:hypothetical protein